jgi:branched-chain amino acid aminotransferase
MILNLDGESIDPDQAGLPLDDGAVLFGDTLFETLKARNGRIRFLEDHLDRLQLSAGLLDFPIDRDRIRQALHDTIARLPEPVVRLRLTVSRGSFTGLDFPPAEQCRFIITALPYHEPEPAERERGAACVFAPNLRVNPLSQLPQMKRGNYADCLYAANHARRKGAREALFRTVDNHVLEGATTNLFILLDGSLITPPAGELVLAGIMRRQVIMAAEHLGLPVVERPVTAVELFDADEVFLTNALIDTLAVASLENRPLRRGPWAGRLRSMVEKQESEGKIPSGNETT